jgi:hypothetical protein
MGKEKYDLPVTKKCQAIIALPEGAKERNENG